MADIHKVLSKSGRQSIHEIAKKAKLSSNTVSKYLGIMEERGQVVKELQPPYKFYRLKTDKGE
jgi:predicted ArsR family transcriptional regulator